MNCGEKHYKKCRIESFYLTTHLKEDIGNNIVRNLAFASKCLYYIDKELCQGGF